MLTISKVVGAIVRGLEEWQRLSQQAAPVPSPEPPTPTENTISNNEVIPCADDKTIIHPMVFENWSIRSSPDGDFIAPQGVGRVPCIVQVEAMPGRSRLISYPLVRANWGILRVGAKSPKDGTVYEMYLGLATRSYQEFLRRLVPVAPLEEAQIAVEESMMEGAV